MEKTAIEKLQPGDYIAFEWEYGSLQEPDIVVDNITSVYDDKVLVHFLYGYKSEAKFVNKVDIIAIGDLSAKGKIKGWSGTFNILLPNHRLLKPELES